MRMNFGQDASFGNSLTGGDVGTETDGNGNGLFKYAPPSGYLACCTASLPEPTIGPNSDTQADDHFNTVLYTGNGATGQDVVVGFQPDWLWFKNRGNTYNHVSYDSSRGATKRLEISVTAAESTKSDAVTDFVATGGGFTIGGNEGAINQSGYNIAVWAWKANGGSTSTNTDGNEDSTVQVNSDAGFSMVLWTGGSNVQTHTFGHGLGAKPAMIIHKRRSSTSDWSVWHQEVSSPDDNYLLLNEPNAPNASTSWEQPTATVFQPYLGSAGQNWISYIFKEVEGYSKFGKYVGNGSTDGTYVFTGFRPAWVMVKNLSDGSQSWQLYDNKRDTFNRVDSRVNPNSYAVEDEVVPFGDFLGNGFKLRPSSSYYGQVNANNNTYIYMAFAEQPAKFSNGK